MSDKQKSVSAKKKVGRPKKTEQEKILSKKIRDYRDDGIRMDNDFKNTMGF